MTFDRLISFIVGLIFCFSSLPMYADTSDSNTTRGTKGATSATTTIQQHPDTLVGYVHEQIQQTDGNQSDTANNDVTNAVNNGTNDKPPASQLIISSEGRGDYNQYYRIIDEFNAGLPPLASAAIATPESSDHNIAIYATNDPVLNLDTPLATMEFFYSANQQKKFGLAAYALNLNGIAHEQQASYASELAKKLNYLLDEKSLYLFDDMPDRDDGLLEPPLGSNNPLEGVPRRSIKLGYIDSRLRKVPIFMERVRVGDKPPIWVFSKQTVLNIESLYELHKPAEFERYLPTWLSKKLLGISVWEYLVLLLFMLVTLAVGWLFSKGVQQAVDWYIKHRHNQRESQMDEPTEQALSARGKGLTDLFEKVTVPTTTTISFGLVFALTSGSFPNISGIATATRPIVWVCFVFSGLWLGIRVINFFANRYQDYRIDSLDEEQFKKARKRQTYLSIFRRIFIFTMILGGIWISLDQFADLEGLGTTLLTSAGIAGAVLGIAAQPTLGNIVAGAQVAVTQPIKIGDTIMLDGVWCEVEDLRYTYAVLKTWDDRRLIVPMKYFVTEVLENWSHTNTNQSSALYIYVDYGTNIDSIRQKFIELVKNHKLWNEEVEPELLTTAISEDSIKLRGKLSSDSPANAWQMECDIREQLLTYIHDKHGDYLPVERLTLTSREH